MKKKECKLQHNPSKKCKAPNGHDNGKEARHLLICKKEE